jgi:hypothetical protein
MRPLAILFACLTALAVPTGALALHSSAGDGTLVVKNGWAPDKVPVVKLTVKSGSVIGQIGSGTIIIDSGPKGVTPEVTGADYTKPNAKSDTAQEWSSTDPMKFRVVNGHFTIVIYGSGVNVFAVGNGSAILQGQPDTPKGDGRYSLEGADFVSMPGSPTKQLLFGDNGN